MAKDNSKLINTLRAIDDINQDISKLRRYIDYEPDGVFEIDAKEAYDNSLGRLLTIRHALEKKRDILKKS